MTDLLGDGSAAPAESPRLLRVLRTWAWVAWAAGLAASLGVAAAELARWDDAGAGRRLGLAGVLLASAVAPAWSLGRRGDRASALRAVWIGPAVAVVSVTRSETTLQLAFAAAGLVALVAGLCLAQSLAVRERTARVPQAPTGDASGARRRLRVGLPLAVPALVLAVLLAPVAALEVPRGGPSLGGRRALRTTSGADAAGTGGGVFVDPSASTGDLASLERTILLEVRPTRDAVPLGNQGALYLRGVPLDEVDEDGRWSEDPALPRMVHDRDDGRADGWCTFGTLPDGEAELGLSVRQLRLDHTASGLCLVHAPAHTAAIERVRVRRAEDGPILAEAARDGTLEYRLATLHPAATPAPDGSSRVRVRDPRFLRVPEGRAAVDTLVATAQVVAQGHRTDLARVRAVIRHLRANYAYRGLGAGLDDAEALRAFVVERAGTCVQFAEAAAFMLRSLGIPTRVATGFLVSEWDEERQIYLGRGRDYHAWIEVDFEGLGWVPFEATPSVPDDADRAGAGEGGDGAFGTRGLGAIVRGLRDAASGGATWAAVALSVVLLAAALAWIARRGRPLEFDPVAGAPEAPSGVPAWDLLLGALARRGFRRRPAQTALEFAADVVRAGGPRLEPFLGLTRRQQAARFGGRPLTPGDTQAIDAFRASL